MGHNRFPVPVSNVVCYFASIRCTKTMCDLKKLMIGQICSLVVVVVVVVDLYSASRNASNESTQNLL